MDKFLCVIFIVIPFISIAQDKDWSQETFSPYPTVPIQKWVRICSKDKDICNSQTDNILAKYTRESFCSTIDIDNCYYKLDKIPFVEKIKDKKIKNKNLIYYSDLQYKIYNKDKKKCSSEHPTLITRLGTQEMVSNTCNVFCGTNQNRENSQCFNKYELSPTMYEEKENICDTTTCLTW